MLLGGYSEDRYTLDRAGGVRSEHGVEHGAGGVNTVPLATYHEVTAIHDPGRTLTLMVCGPGERGRWGYLDPATGRHHAAAPDPDFGERLKALNPQHE